MRSLLLVLVLCGLITQVCGFDDDEPGSNCTPVPVSEQEDLINQYIDQQGWTMQSTASGLRYVIETPGTGDNIMYGDTIELDYQGALLTGGTFDSGSIGPVVFSQGGFIPGFEEGLLLFNEGAQGIIILPSALAYGCFPPQGSTIGQNQVLLFEITVTNVDS